MSQKLAPLNARSNSRSASSIFAAVFLLLLTGTLLYRQQQPSTMSTQTPIQSPISSLHLQISGDFATKSPLTLTVTLENKGDKPVTILTWNTPLDEKAAPIGIFKFKSTRSGDYAQSQNLKLNRLLPPQDDAYLELAPRETIKKDFDIKAPEVTLTNGEEYEVQAKGFWGGVWEGRRGDVEGNEGFREDFESNTIVVKVSS
jgi:hypothetical protein